MQGVESGSPQTSSCTGLAGNSDVIVCRADWCFHRCYGASAFPALVSARMPLTDCMVFLPHHAPGRRGKYQECYALTFKLLERDPYHLGCLPTHLATCLQLGKKNELFIRGHRSVSGPSRSPTAAVSCPLIAPAGLCVELRLQRGSCGCPSRLVEEYPERAISWFAVGCYHACARQHLTARQYFGKCTAMEPLFVPAWIAFGNAFAALDESDQVSFVVMLPCRGSLSPP